MMNEEKFKEKVMGDGNIPREGLHNTEPHGIGSMMAAKTHLGQWNKEGYRRSNRRA